MPDFDIDFCMDGRDRVIDYVADKYGRERVSQIITYGTMAAKAVVRDVGRVLGMTLRLRRQHRQARSRSSSGITLDDALEQGARAQASATTNEEEVKNLLDLARSARRPDAQRRHARRRRGDRARQCSPTSRRCTATTAAAASVTQFDKDDVEAVGLVKFDFLGLRTLTILDWAVKIINARRARARRAAARHRRAAAGRRGDLRAAARLPDRRRCSSSNRAACSDLMRRLQPDRFEDIIALVALFRPGPLDRAWSTTSSRASTAARHDRLPAPALEPILRADLRHHGVPGAGDADRAGPRRLHARRRRPAAPRDGQEEGRGDGASSATIFVDGAAKRRRRRSARPTQIFDLMEKFAGYGFNKSHSAAYALLVVPDRVAEGALPGRVHGGHAVRGHGRHRQGGDADRRVRATSGSQVQPPDVNHSRLRVRGRRRATTIRYGLGAVKGVGQGAVEAHRRGARGARAVHEPRGSVPPPRSAEGQPARARGADPLGQPRCARRRTARR